MSWVEVRTTDEFLRTNHYLGPSKTAKMCWMDDLGVAVFGSPTSRHLPKEWLELKRWCLAGEKDGGSRQWRAIVSALRETKFTTIVSYSDPSVGHTGALYRACGWIWAPTWQRLRPPPTGGGSWTEGKPESVKDRWVYPIAADALRQNALSVKDTAKLRKFEYVEPKMKGQRFVCEQMRYKEWAGGR